MALKCLTELRSIPTTAPFWSKRVERFPGWFVLRNNSAHPREGGDPDRSWSQTLDFFTYIVASSRNGTLYTGSTDNLLIRAAQHQAKTFEGFTARYGVHRLVWFERHPTREAAFRRERQIKKWNRAWKLRLIEAANPDWNDLAEELRLGDLKDAKDWVPAFAGMSGNEDDSNQ